MCIFLLFCIASSGVDYGNHSFSDTLPELKSVTKAVVKVAPDRWLAIGLEMGYSSGELDAFTATIPNQSDKLLKIIYQKADDIGRERTAQLMLEVCKRVPNPVHVAVMKEILKLDDTNRTGERTARETFVMRARDVNFTPTFSHWVTIFLGSIFIMQLVYVALSVIYV
jgi:hypothetical protein